MVSSYLSEASGDIENRGALAAQGNMTLAANNLDLQGQVAAGGDLTLLGLDTVQIRDTAEVPFVGFAGGDLLVQGNEQVDIVALSHSDSGLYSYGDMVLRSANPVGGDAHYWSGGNFQIETLDGEAGELFSPIDPIIRALGDVTIGAYLGSSLHILAGGSVDIGTALITAPDAGTLGVDFLQETIELSDGTLVEIDGGARPTLDVRAGVAPEAIGLIPLDNPSGVSSATDTFFNDAIQPADPNIGNLPTSADITVGDVGINAANGLVLLTNQYEPNAELEGSISITGNGVFGQGIDARGFAAFGGQGGAVYLDARENIEVVNSSIQTSGSGTVGDIVLLAEGTVRFERQDRLSGAASNLLGEGTGGTVRINAGNLEILNRAELSTSTFGNGDAGNVVLTVRNRVTFDNSAAFSRMDEGATGNGGDVVITAGTLEVLNGAQLDASTLGFGDAGNVVIVASDRVRFDDANAFSTVASGVTGQGGSVKIAATVLEIVNGSQLQVSTLGFGDAGNVVIVASDRVVFDNRSVALSNIASGAQGIGGNIEITTPTLEVLNGSQLQTATLGTGDAGNVEIIARDQVIFEGNSADGQFPSAAFSSVELGATGTGGNVDISTAILKVLNGSLLRVATLGTGDAGNVEIIATTLEILNGSQLQAATLGTGDAGNVVITARDLVRFEGTSADGQLLSAAFTDVASNAQGNGGNIEITTTNLEVLNGAGLQAAALGIGDAGNVVITAYDRVVFDGGSAFSDIALGARGRGGNVVITATTLEVLNGAGLQASTQGDGYAGNVVITVSDLVRFEGTSTDGKFGSVALSNVGPQARGRGGMW
jgi:adhesin HecA-like repeat protein